MSTTADNSPIAIPVVIDTAIAVDIGRQPIAFGVPFAKGRLRWPCAATIQRPGGGATPLQATPLAHWSDGSIQWLLLECLLPALPAGRSELTVRVDSGVVPAADGGGLRIEQRDGWVAIHTGALVFAVAAGTEQPLLRVRSERETAAELVVGSAQLTDRRGRRHGAQLDTVQIETAGSLRTSLVCRGSFGGRRGLRFQARLCFFAGTGLARLCLMIHNPRRARHRGGLWDLGDPGSYFFRDLSLELQCAGDADSSLLWRSELPQQPQSLCGNSMEIYQDSSGGERWQGRNHANRSGRVPCRFRGYQVRAGEMLQQGRRAEPAPGVFALEIGKDAIDETVGRRRIAETVSVDARMQRGGNRRRRREIHVGDPQRNDVTAGVPVPLDRIATPAVDDAFEIELLCAAHASAPAVKINGFTANAAESEAPGARSANFVPLWARPASARRAASTGSARRTRERSRRTACRRSPVG